MSTDRIRVLRVLEYEGPREWVEAQLADRSVKGERVMYVGNDSSKAVIREAIVGEVPVVLGTEPREEPKDAEPKPERIYHHSWCALMMSATKCTCDDKLGTEPLEGVLGADAREGHASDCAVHDTRHVGPIRLVGLLHRAHHAHLAALGDDPASPWLPHRVALDA